MANESISALGPLFGPDFITIQVNDETNRLFELEVYPDANNGLLRANGLPMQFYFVPQRVYLAKKQDSPEDFDFGMTLFKGLVTPEDTVGITDAMTTGGAVSVGGGICSFSTTFAIPDSVIQGAIQQLKNATHPPAPPRIAAFFLRASQDPTPLLGIVPILSNGVTIESPQFAADPKAPMYLSAQGNGKGSIEASSISSFLVTMNTLAAGAVSGSLKKGVSPFTVHYNMQQQYYINACDIHMDIDVDKVFDQFSGAVDAGGFLGISDVNLSANYQNCVTSGGIKTIIKMGGADVDPDLKKLIDKEVSDMQQRALDLVKKEIFDWQPQPDAPATAKKGVLAGIFGGAAVSMKANYQKRGLHLTQDFTIDTSVSKEDTVSGDLSDLEPAIKANVDKYLAEVDLSEGFKKIQVAATTNINWNEKLPDGTSLADPIKSAQIQVSYPDFSSAQNNQLQLKSLADGFHYTIGHVDTTQAPQLARWTADNPNDVINIAFLKLDNKIPGWDPDQVKITKVLAYDPSDPRVDISNNQTTITTEVVNSNHAPVITPDEVGYIFVKFVLAAGPLPAIANVTLTCTVGGRTDTFNITGANQKNVIWEIFSDKYVDADSFQYSLQVTVNGPSFTDPPVQYQSTSALPVPLPPGRIKYVGTKVIALPAPSAADLATINDYVKRSAAALAAGAH